MFEWGVDGHLTLKKRSDSGETGFVKAEGVLEKASTVRQGVLGVLEVV